MEDLLIGFSVSYSVAISLITKYSCSVYFAFIPETAVLVFLQMYMMFVDFEVTFQLSWQLLDDVACKYSWSGHELLKSKSTSTLLGGFTSSYLSIYMIGTRSNMSETVKASTQ